MYKIKRIKKQAKRARIRIQAYGPSSSARELSRYLGVKRLYNNPYRLHFTGREQDIIINWGIPKILHNSKYVNPINAVRIAVCKLKCLNKLKTEGISVPEYTTEKPTEGKWVARTILNARSGVGAVVAEASGLPNAPLYTKYIAKDAEFRVIVVNGKAVDAKQKLKRRDFEGERQPYIWACDNGYVMARQVAIPDNITELGVAAVNAIGLIIGAVDIILKGDVAYVLEVNSAPGLAGETIKLVGDAIADYVREL